jgi:hypothetical protein
MEVKLSSSIEFYESPTKSPPNIVPSKTPALSTINPSSRNYDLEPMETSF